MSVNVIDTIKPKNGGSFPVVEAVDVAISGTQRLPAALAEKANVTALAEVSAQIANKANQSTVDALIGTVAAKASQYSVDQVNSLLSTKANQSSLDTTNATLAEKANTSDIINLNVALTEKADKGDVETEVNNLQAQIDSLITPVTQDAEVENARVDANGITHTTLKERADSDYESTNNKIAAVGADVNSLHNDIYNTYERKYNNDNALSTTSASGHYGVYFTEPTYVKSIKLLNPSSSTVKYRYVHTADGNPMEVNSDLVCSDEITVEGDTITVNQYLSNSKGIIIDAGTYNYIYANVTDLPSCKIMQTNAYAANDVSVRDLLANYCFAGEITINVSEERITDHTAHNNKSLNNNVNLANTVSYGYYAFYCTTPTYVKSITPIFDGSTGDFSYRYIYDKSGEGFANDSMVSLGEIKTGRVGDSISIEKVIDNHIGLIINSEAVLKYCNTNNAPFSAAGIMSVTKGMRTDELSTNIHEVLDLNFAGAFNIVTDEDIYVKKSDVAQLTNNYLIDKKIMAVGDSMVKGHSLPESDTWLSIIANRNSMQPDNRGYNGAYMSNVQYGGHDNSVYQKVCVPASEYYISDADIEEYDYILVYAGTNDCQANITIGSTDSTNPSEFCGALNLICQTLQTRAPQAHIGFITPYLRAGIESRCKNYVNAIVAVCAKYSIPVFNNADNGSICWSNASIRSTLTLDDTYHLNKKGMEYVSFKYEQFLRSI